MLHILTILLLKKKKIKGYYAFEGWWSVLCQNHKYFFTVTTKSNCVYVKNHTFPEFFLLFKLSFQYLWHSCTFTHPCHIELLRSITTSIEFFSSGDCALFFQTSANERKLYNDTLWPLNLLCRSYKSYCTTNHFNDCEFPSRSGGAFIELVSTILLNALFYIHKLNNTHCAFNYI